MRSVSTFAGIASAFGAAVVAACIAYGQASAQGYPTRPLTVLVNVPPGSLSDFLARTVGHEASKLLGQPLVVESRPGAAGKIAMHAMLNAPRDGHLFAVVTPSAMTVNPLVDSQAGYDPVKDLLPLTLAIRTPLVVVVHPSLPARSLPDFVAHARANPGRLAYGSFGIGSSSNLWTEELLLTLRISATHVPYKGEAPALAELAGGQLQFMVASGSARPLVDSGKLAALATSGTKRWDLFPNLPTYGETGIGELQHYSYSPWLGFAAASGIPDHAAAKLHEALVNALRAPEVRSVLALRGVEVVASTMREFGAEIQAELERNRKVLASGRIQLR
ncbi:MAG: Bug family tripartite tricarboxylate transporter substrate binding protein [Betaproteobacteria bacterium]